MKKPLELLPEVVRSPLKDMRAFYAEPSQIKHDEIAFRQVRALREFQKPDAKKLGLVDVMKVFKKMRGLKGATPISQ